MVLATTSSAQSDPQGPPVLGAALVTDGVKSFWNTNGAVLSFGITQGANTGSATPSAGSTTYWPLWNIGPNNQAAYNSTVTANILTVATAFTNLYFVCSTPPGLLRTNTLELITNGLPTGFKSTIAGAVDTRGTNLTHAVLVLPGTEVGVRITTQGGSPATKFAWAVTCRQ
jgi:hypothetical protein